MKQSENEYTVETLGATHTTHKKKDLASFLIRKNVTLQNLVISFESVHHQHQTNSAVHPFLHLTKITHRKAFTFFFLC